MAKFGSFKYGTSVKYGTGVSVEFLTWSFLIFWDDAFVDESPIMVDLQVSRGRDHLLSSGGAWERFRPGEATGVFDNSDGRFDAYNTSGPLYGFLLPGRVVRITVEVLPPYAEVSTTYDVLRGIIDDIQTGDAGGVRQAQITVKDGLFWLEERSIALALVQDEEALVTAAAIATQVNFDDVDDWSIVQLGTDSVAVAVAFGNEPSAISLINEFVDAEAGQVFHSKSGVLTFVTNDYTETDTTDIDDDQGHITRDFELKQPWQVVRTRAQITANPLVEESATVLWSLGVDDFATWDAATEGAYPTSPYLSVFSPTTEMSVDAIFSNEGAATSPVVDYYIFQGFPADAFSTWLDFSANDAFGTVDIGNGLRLTFSSLDLAFSGGNPAQYVVPWVEITANPITASDPVIVNASDLAAIVIYGEKTFELDNPWIQTQAYAQAYADYVVAQLKDAHLFPTIIIESRGTLQYAPELYVSKIHLTIPAYGIDDTFRVGKIEHKWLNQNGLATQTTLKLEPVLGVLE